MVPYDCLLCIIMRLKDLRKDKEGLSKALLAIIVVVLLLASTAAVVLMTMSGSSTNETVQNGDYVTLNYTGTVLINGVYKTFDTSLWTVATDNSTYPKTCWFSAKSESSYSTLKFYVGKGTVVTGFDQGVLGMKVGEPKTISISPSQGYGEMDTTKLTTFSINDNVPVFVTTTISKFASDFGAAAVVGLSMTHPVYEWPVTVLSVDSNAGTVMYQNQPTINTDYHIYGSSDAKVVAGWNITVTSIESTVNEGAGQISFTNNIDDADSWEIQGYNSAGSLFILINVNTAAGTAVMNFNNPLKGQTMVFTVTVVAIRK
ncbi:MAG: FKBP-type peptidyl-prolyl cis-trans isomerase [Methanomassiliicoccales archaeon PtaU1.Bin124]|nr:MAG: FKBP-type peptidyl-prolyl cis-trans isomerase [Methanomassiliicoccales archaeon PtaU1.Bin124]